jgi:multidrug efflux pump subunit AcrA (membrane-fusion protein)
LIQQHEEAKLTQAQDHQLLARAEIGLHQAKLTTAREARAWEEQKHRVEIMRQRLSVRSQQQQAAIEFARLTAQQAEIELQLAQLVEVRAPFAGTIKRIEWEEMKDEKLTVWVYLLVGGSR